MQAVNLEEQIKMLVELQSLDTHILKSERELEMIPEEIKKLEEEFVSQSTGVKKAEEAIKALQVRRKEREGDLNTKEESVRKYQSQLYQIKTNKEYSALEQEIARIKADNSLIEEDIIKLFDQVDVENQKLAKEKEALKAEEVKVQAEKKQKLEDAERIEGELAAFRAQRAELAGKVDKVVLSKYERLMKNKDGLGIVSVAGDSCQGCFRIMPPQVINEIRMKKDLVVCENCARILYIEE